MAGFKIKRHRETPPRESRKAFGASVGVSGSTVQGWEEEGKRAKPAVANRLAEAGIADHADWNRPAPRQADLPAAMAPTTERQFAQ